MRPEFAQTRRCPQFRPSALSCRRQDEPDYKTPQEGRYFTTSLSLCEKRPRFGQFGTSVVPVLTQCHELCIIGVCLLCIARKLCRPCRSGEPVKPMGLLTYRMLELLQRLAGFL